MVSQTTSVAERMMKSLSRKTCHYLPRVGLIPALVMVVALLVPQQVVGQIIARKAEAVTLKSGLRDMLQSVGAKSLKKVTVTVGREESASLMTARGVKLEGAYTVYKGVGSDGEEIGTVVMVDEAGKEGPLQLVVAFTPTGEIYDMGFTIFGEDRGKPALSWPFLKQFIGKDSEQEMVVGKGIDAITGATWTSNSVAAAVRKAVVLFDEFVKKNG